MVQRRHRWPSFAGHPILLGPFGSWACGLVWLAILFLPGCSGCQSELASKAVEESRQPQQQQNQPAAPESGSLPQPGETVTAAEGRAQTNGSEQSGTTPPRSPAESFSQAKSLFQQSQRKSKASDAGGAFKDATKAWDLVRRFPQDPKCRSLKDEIARQLDGLAAKANQQYAGSSGLEGKTLIEE